MDFFICIFIMLAISLFLVVRLNLNPAAGPLVSAAIIVVTLLLGGIANLLYVGCFALLTFAVFALFYVFYLKKAPLKETLCRFFTPATVFFIAASAAFFIILRDKQAGFRVWDEFSFWGISIKAIFENRKLYTMFTSSLINVSYLPALPLFSYFTMFLSPRFIEWRAILAYDTLLMAVMTLLWSRVKWKNAGSVIVFSAFSALGLYCFLYGLEGQYLYTTVYADLPLGVLFGGAIMSWFALEGCDRKVRYFAFLSANTLLVLAKDMGLALALGAAAVVAVDMLISGDYPFGLSDKRGRKALSALPQLAFPLLPPVLFYKLWSLHVAAAVRLDISPEPYEYSVIEIFTGKDPYFPELMKNMTDIFWNGKVAMFGTIAEMCVVFFALPLLAALLVRNKKKAIRLGSLSVMLLAGFAVYYLFMAYLYTSVFVHPPDAWPLSFGRYLTSYCVGWFYAVVGVFAFEVGKPKTDKLSLLPACAVFILSLFSTYHYAPTTPDQYLLTSDALYLKVGGVRELIQQYARRYYGCFDVNDRFYCVCQESDGGEWLVFNYEFQPAYVVNTVGGGNFVASEEEAKTTPYGVYCDSEIFAKHLREQKVDYVFLYKINDYFREEFSPMFTDNLEYTIDGSVRLYRVVDDGTAIRLEPVLNPEQIS